MWRCAVWQARMSEGKESPPSAWPADYTPVHSSRPHPMLFQPYYQYCLMLALFLLWYLYVCLRSSNTVLWFYLFLHTVLRLRSLSTQDPVYLLFKLSYMTNTSSFKTQFSYFSSSASCWPTETSWNWDLEVVKKTRSIPCKKLIVFPKKWSLWMWSVARMEQFCFQVKSGTSQQTCNRLRALHPIMYGFLTILGTTDLRDSTLTQWGRGHLNCLNARSRGF